MNAHRVFIVWAEDMSEGIVLTDEAKFLDLRDRATYGDDLTEDMINRHGGEALIWETVELTKGGLN